MKGVWEGRAEGVGSDVIYHESIKRSILMVLVPPPSSTEAVLCSN